MVNASFVVYTVVDFLSSPGRVGGRKETSNAKDILAVDSVVARVMGCPFYPFCPFVSSGEVPKGRYTPRPLV